MMTREEMKREKEINPSIDLNKYYSGDVKSALKNLNALSNEIPCDLRDFYTKCIVVIEENVKVLEKRIK